MHTLATLLLLLAMSSNPTAPSGQPGPMQPGDYTPAKESKVVTWNVKRVTPPSPVYVGLDDKLVCGAASSQANEVVTVNYRLLRAADGKVVPGQLTVAPASDRSIKVETRQLAEGFLLSVSVKAAVASTRGQTFIRVFLGAGALGAGQPSYMLMADYVTTAMAPAHPNGRVLAPTEGPGWLQQFVGTAPLTGSPIIQQVPANARWRIASGLVAFTTDAVAGNRTVEVLITDSTGGSFFYQAASTLVQGPSTVFNYAWGPGIPFGAASALQIAQIPLPVGLVLLSGQKFDIQAVGADSGDKFNAIELMVEEWLDNV